MKKKLPNFKYNANTQPALIFCGNLSYFIATGSILLILILSVKIHLTFLFLLLILWLIYSSIDNKNKSITLDQNFFVICGRIIWYSNIEKIFLNKPKQELIIETTDNREIKINSSHFPTNARKDFKISRNKAIKFFKVSHKLITKVQSVSPQTQIKIKE